MTDIIPATIPATADELRAAADKLRAALAALEVEEKAEQARQAAVIREAQTARAQKVFDAARANEDKLSEIGTAHYQEAIAAAIAGDLNGAYSGFIGYLGSRSARGRVRTDAQGAAHILGVAPHTAADVAYRQMPFSDFIDSNLRKAVEANVESVISSYLVQEIDGIEAATAYLKQGK